ncbi:unnamed protein product [Effrenium voratum]|nr:unnamed protein product [Effrenium voratum]
MDGALLREGTAEMKRRADGSMASGQLDAPGPKVLKDEGLVYTILMCLSLAEARSMWHLRQVFFKVLKDKVVPLLALTERDWSIVRSFMDGAFQYNLEVVFTEAVLHSDYEGLRLLAERKFAFGSAKGDARLKPFVQEALSKGSVERLSLLRSLRYSLAEDLLECTARGGIAEQLLSEGSIYVDFLGSRNSFRFSMLDLATSAYAENQVDALCKHRASLYKVPFVLSSFLKAGAATNSFLRVDGCGYLLLLALAAESFNFVYLLIQEVVDLRAVLERYDQELVLMVNKAMGQRPGVLDLLHFCGFRLFQDQGQFDAPVLSCIQRQDFGTVERISKLGFDLHEFAARKQAELSSLLQSGLEDLCQCATGSADPNQAADGLWKTPEEGESREGPDGRPQTAVRRLVEIDRRVLELHFQSELFLRFADGLMSGKEFVQMRHIVEVHPHAFRAYFRENYKAMEDLLFDAFCRRQISLIVDLTSLRLPIVPFLERRQAQLDAVLLQSWFASKAWTELVMLRSEVRDFDFSAFFRRTREQIDRAVMDIIRDGYWLDLHKLGQLGFDFDQFFSRRFEEVSASVLQFMTMPHPHFVLLRELSALNFPWARFMEEHEACILASKDQEYMQFLISLGSFDVGSKVYRVVEQTCKLYHSMANTMFSSGSVEEADIEEISAGQVEVPAESPVIETPSSSAAGETLPEARVPAAVKATMVRARELARLACQKKIDAKKVMALLICRGMYCWNPLKADMEDCEGDGKDSARVWSQVESVLNFLDAKDEPAPGFQPTPTAAAAMAAAAVPVPAAAAMAAAAVPVPAVPAAPAAPAVPAAAAAPAPAPPGMLGQGPLWMPPVPLGQPQLQTLAQLQSLLQFQQIYQASPHQQQLMIQIVCLTQRAEEHVFDKKIEFFWHGLLDRVLPLDRDGAPD